MKMRWWWRIFDGTGLPHEEGVTILLDVAVNNCPVVLDGSALSGGQTHCV